MLHKKLQVEVSDDCLDRYAGYAYWGFLLLLGICSRFVHWAMYRRKPRGTREIESQIYPARGTLSDSYPWLGHIAHWVQTHLLVASPLDARGREILTCTFSNRAEALAVAGFWILSIIFSVVGYRTFEGNI